MGNSAIIFCALIGGKWCSLKCYTWAEARLKTIYGDRFLEGELVVPTCQGKEKHVDIVVSPWIEGVTLDRYIDSLVEKNDIEKLNSLSARFDRMALDLLQRDVAHGDITCENIIVDECGQLHLIDFDASYTPLIAETTSSELGTAAYQHPLRTTKDFDHTIDDYSLALISTALSAIALDPTLYNLYKSEDGLLYNPNEATTRRSEPLAKTFELFARHGKPFAYAIAQQLTLTSVALPNLARLMHCKVEGVHCAAVPTSTFSRDGRWGFLNDFNRQVIPPIFDKALPFNENYAAVRIGPYWHYIDPRCQVVINCHQYEAIKSFRNGAGRGLKGGVWCVIE